MILKKPYAFLIKYFRIIHIVLSLLLIIGAYKTLGIVKFFDAYVKAGYRTAVVTGLSRVYTPISIFILIFTIVFLITALLVLMVHKKKPYQLYLLMVVYYLIIFFGLFYVSSILKSFETSLLVSTLSRSIRDILIMLYIPQIVFIVFIIIRAIGFDIKKFDFSSDLKEMELSSADAEEFEVNINFEGYKAQRKAHRIFRESIYYIKENKFIVLCIITALAAIISYAVYINSHSNYDKYYTLGKTINYEKLNITFQNAIITNLDYNGNIIDDNNYYLVVKTNIKNNSGSTVKVNYDNFKLNIDGVIINPTVYLAEKFIDYAPSTILTSIAHNTEISFGLVYQITKSQIKNNMKLQIHMGTVYDKGEYLNKRIFVKLNPSLHDNLKIVGNYNLEDEILFNDTFLNNSSLKINDYVIVKNYMYEYQSCRNEENCQVYHDILTVPVKNNRQNNKIVILKVNYIQDSSTLYNNSYNSLQAFASNFVKVQYKVDNTVYSADSLNVTPMQAGDFMAFEVPSNVDNASIIQAIITIRNNKYIVNMKI